MNNKKTKRLTVSAICIALNMILGFVGSATKLPVYMDTIGTFFTAVVYGPLYGAMVGVITNIVSALLLGPKDIPFALVSIAIGLITGFVANKMKNFTIKTAVICGIVCGIIAPIIGTPIGIWVYGGLTGTGMDFLFIWLKQSGMSVFTASFIPKLINNLIDKTASAIITSVVIYKLPQNLIKNMEFHNLLTEKTRI